MIDWLFKHLPVLITVTPLLGALVTMFLPGKFRPWVWTQGVVTALFIMVLCLVGQVYTFDKDVIALSYEIGRWPAAWGIEYRIDHLNVMVLLIISKVGVVTTIFARRSIADEIPTDRLHIFYAIWQLCLMGMLGMSITGDAFNVYVLLEISALTVYTLIAIGKDRDRRALTAALRYLILGSIGATFILMGIGYLLMYTGTLNMAEMQLVLQAKAADGSLMEDRVPLIAFAFLVAGIGLKAALFPMHLWLPNAYSYAPSVVSAMLAATATKVGVYVGIRFLLTIFGADFSFGWIPSRGILMTMAVCAILWCSLVAIRQDNIKTMLAYSSVAQIGYMVLGFSLANEPGVAGSVIHLFNHALMKGGMFLALGCVIYRLGGARLSDLRGLGRVMPWTMAAFTAGGMGLIGFPLTAGFISKWYLVLGCIEAGHWHLAAVVLVGSLLAVIYVWRVVEAIYFGKRPDDAPAITEAPADLLLPTWLLIGGSLVFGCWASWTGGMAQSAAKALLLTTAGAAP